jgi:hypothetical protein
MLSSRADNRRTLVEQGFLAFTDRDDDALDEIYALALKNSRRQRRMIASFRALGAGSQVHE